MPDPAEPAATVEQFDCPTCEVPAGSTCRHPRRQGRSEDHTLRFMLVPQLRAELEVKTPADRGPGRAWEMGLAIDAAVPEAAAKPTRVGYARCSTAQQELQSQLGALNEAGCDPVFSEKIGTRVKVRLEFVKAMDFARTIRKAVPHQRVIFTVHEMKRLGRGAIELLTIAEDLRHHDIQLELFTVPLQGVYTRPGTAPPCSRSSSAWPSPSASTSGRSPSKARRPPAGAAVMANGPKSSTRTRPRTPAACESTASPCLRSPEKLQTHLFNKLIPALINSRPPAADPADLFRFRRRHDLVGVARDGVTFVNVEMTRADVIPQPAQFRKMAA